MKVCACVRVRVYLCVCAHPCAHKCFSLQAPGHAGFAPSAAPFARKGLPFGFLVLVAGACDVSLLLWLPWSVSSRRGREALT